MGTGTWLGDVRDVPREERKCNRVFRGAPWRGKHAAMLRQARLDAPGTLYHVIARRIEHKAIFVEGSDYADFLRRLEGEGGMDGGHSVRR